MSPGMLGLGRIAWSWRAHLRVIPGAIVPLPGHTPGSLVVTIAGAAFVGDLFRGGIVGSPAEVHFYMCDLDDNHRDVRTLLDRLAPTAVNAALRAKSCTGVLTGGVAPLRLGLRSRYTMRPSGKSSIRSSAKAGREQSRTSLSRS